MFGLLGPQRTTEGTLRVPTRDTDMNPSVSDLDLGLQFGRSLESFRLPQRDLGQGRDVVDLMSNPLTMHRSQDRGKSSARPAGDVVPNYH